jgi:hypothetical protein
MSVAAYNEGSSTVGTLTGGMVGVGGRVYPTPLRRATTYSIDHISKMLPSDSTTPYDLN